MSKKASPAAKDGTKRISSDVKASTAMWIKMKGLEDDLTIGEVIDLLVEKTTIRLMQANLIDLGPES